MFGILSKIFGSTANLQKTVELINASEEDFKKLTDEDLKEKTYYFRNELQKGRTLDDILPEAFAAVRESARRTLGQRHFDVQLMGGAVLHSGGIAEMLTGEGKTLAATAPVYLNALAGKGVHIVTVNEYLAKRDTVWMSEVYHALGLRVACLVHEGALMYDPAYVGESALLDKERDMTGSFRIQEEFLRPVTRREAYLADITYGTNHEFGFDYLRDNLVYELDRQVQRGHYFAIIDEVDSILIDESRTPLIISMADQESSSFYKSFARVVDKLVRDDDYAIDEKLKTASITDSGINKVERMIGVRNIYAPENLRLVHYMEESLKAKALYLRDRDYLVKDGEVIIVDQFTGRMMLGRRYSGGLHQAIEAKEGVLVKEESQTYARITIQNYFRKYEKLAGMTGTAQTSAEEFHKVYNLEVVSIPPNKPLVRDDMQDAIYRSLDEKYRAVAREIKERREKGQPVLLGTPSIEKNEIISGYLKRAGIPHEVLNAKNNEREGAIIAQAGKPGAVTVATNMAGRGVDIILGGNPGSPADAQKVRAAGGLHVIGTERHEARRIDNQLRGRAGRQGDPGSSQFFLSLEDDLLRIFGGDRIQGLMRTLNVPEDTPIQAGMLSRAVSQAQAKIEGHNFDARKHLLEYDDVLNKQREGFYKRRSDIIVSINKEDLEKRVYDAATGALDKLSGQFFGAVEVETESGPVVPSYESFKTMIVDSKIVKDEVALKDVFEKIKELPADEAEIEFKLFMDGVLGERVKDAANDPQIIMKLLGISDMLWVSHLENIDGLSESVRLRAYAQHDPLVEFRRESHRLYLELFENFDMWVFMNIFRSLSTEPAAVQGPAISIGASPKNLPEVKNIGRNDPCPCGSGKKYKKCHGA